MKNVSNEFKNIIKTGGPFYAYAVVTLKNGEKLTLDSDNDFYISGNGYVEDGGDGFPLGSALSKSITLVIDNLDERYSKNDFYYARITLFTESDMDNRTFEELRDIKGDKILDVSGKEILTMKSRLERINEGTFTVLEPSAVGDTIELVGYDDMYKSDKEFKSKLSYPTTAGQLLREACSACDLMLGSPTFQNQDFVINAIPEKVTCREIIGYIAMIAVGNAVIQNGTLVIKSYDFSPIKTLAVANELIEDAGYHILRDFQSDPTIGTDPIQITGISTSKKVENDTVILLKGADDYAIDITNPLIEGNEDEALNLIGNVLIGTNMRSFSGEFSPDPTIEFMDMVCILDRKDKVYPSFVTAHNFDYLGNSSVSCSVKDPERQKSTYYSEATKVYEKANKEIQKNKTDFETAVENLNKTLETSTGMYSTEEVQPDGSIITYIHDKPVKDESKNVLKVTSEAIGISNDGGKTYPYGLFLTGDLITRILYAIGINANYINAGSFTVKDKNGNITFYADTDTGRVTINAESVTITGKSVEDISNEIVNNFADTVYKSDMDLIKSEVKNKIETWYQDTDPSVNWGITVEKPWCDIDGNPILDVNGNEITLLFEELKSEHEGDLWKNLTTNDEYIYRSGHWMKMQVPDEVFDEIDGKAQVFINTPVPPYRVGDLWFDADTQEILTCVESRDTGKCVKSDWQKKTKYTDDSGLNSFIKSVYDPKIAELQSQIDGQIETWYYDYEPTLQNEPASLWTTSMEREKHLGDLFYWSSKGFAYRFMKDEATWKWQLVQDTDITKALAVAEKAQDTADHKRRVFVVTPQPPYDIGDLWVQGDDGDIMRCRVPKSDSSEYASDDWEKASKYTDDTRANEVQKELETVNKDLQNQIDGKIETYNQATDPSTTWTTEELKQKHVGDLWYNSKEETTQRWNGTAWSKLSDAEAKAAKNLAITKKRVFSVTPYTPYDKDDLWVQGTSGDLMRCVTSRQSGSYVASDWTKATKYTDDSAINNFIANTYKADLEDIKNQIDQKIETWFQPTDPSLGWTGKELQPLFDISGDEILDINGDTILITVESEKIDHEGDLWKNSKTGDEYIYRSGIWIEMPVPDSVFDEIDGKASIYIAQPVPPYNVGDVWFTGTDILTCVKGRDSGEYVESDWQKKNNYTDDTTVNDFIQNVYDPTVEDIQNQIDGKIDTYYFDYDPNNSNYPASEWTTASERQKHVGDLFFWESKGFTYRYMKVDTSFQWVRVKDADIESAMQKASTAQDTADGKRRVFTSTPQPPYDVGDLWTQGSTGDLMRCRTARATGNYTSSDWILATKYTDDTVANKALAEIKVLDGKIKLKVSSEDVESIIEQKADSIRMQAKSISWKSEGSSMSPTGYLKCSGAEIDGTIRSTDIIRTVYMTAGYNQYWYETNKVGLIGTNGFADTNFAIRGLNFDLDDGGHYMTWASKDTPSSTSYAMKMTYARKSFSSFTADSINMGCNIDMHNYKLLNAKFGDGGITGTMNFVQRFKESDGTKQDYSGCYMTFKNGILVKAAWHS